MYFDNEYRLGLGIHLCEYCTIKEWATNKNVNNGANAFHDKQLDISVV